jgi:MFS family permease
VPLLVTQERGEPVFVAGAVLAIGSFGWSGGSWLQGQARFAGRRWMLVMAGGTLLALGILGLVAILVTGASVWLIGPAMVLAGLGMGVGSTSLSVLVLDLVPLSGQSSASAALQLSDVLGSVLGIAAASAVFTALHSGAGDQPAYFVIWTGLAALAAVTVVTGRRCRVRAASADQGVPAR